MAENDCSCHWDLKAPRGTRWQVDPECPHHGKAEAVADERTTYILVKVTEPQGQQPVLASLVRRAIHRVYDMEIMAGTANVSDVIIRDDRSTDLFGKAADTWERAMGRVHGGPADHIMRGK